MRPEGSIDPLVAVMRIGFPMKRAGLQDGRLNGAPGVLVSFDDTSKRWRVVLRAGPFVPDNTYKAARPANLVMCNADGSERLIAKVHRHYISDLLWLPPALRLEVPRASS